MPFIKRLQLDPSLRKEHESIYKSRLRQALMDPGLSAEQRQRIQAEIAQVGKPKVYDANSPPKPGAISFTQ